MAATVKTLMTKTPPKRFDFVGVKHTLPIDQDIWDHTQQYVVDQINIMKRRGSAPDPPLTPEEFKDLVYVTAKYPQQIRNLRKQDDHPINPDRADAV